MLTKERLIRTFDRQASQYEKRRMDNTQKRWRQNLLGEAKGEVLELAVGAGANFPFYASDVKVTATDFSKAMLEKAKQAASLHQVDAEFICGDIEGLNFSDQSFDTIISTLSLCCYDQPLIVLGNMKRWCKPNGTILLMEHGISTNSFISLIQKAINPLHYRIVGCHQTRNIPEMIQQSGIIIEKTESHWFNMVHLIWAKPGRIAD
ncbi:class I SAM-dependent methyltransferase [Neobacillus mesonae]|uniref:class I SAM-dependent methyltransferase n=1 Tax=Neobacillus mesonae TaxID=1193713 RepID=UPI002E1C80B9|nr:methyltransferase domain-containing protein [Neobacillus mesonae]MED4207529.1 methyltransferase domain-containing protein [Neobacillus mesonae]